jgi:protein-S-isoprenylcysteine O-methyltransferase Ste14
VDQPGRAIPHIGTGYDAGETVKFNERLVMHYLAGALLILQWGMIWILDKRVSFGWLDFVAWGLWTVAMVLLFLPMLTLHRQGRVPQGSSYVNTEVLVDAGIYAIVRHPQYLGWMLMYLVVFLFNPRLEVGAVGLIGFGLLFLIINQEEKFLVKKFGDAYVRYMQSVPGINLLTGILRWFFRPK